MNMVMIRQYAVAHNGIVQVAVPEEYNEQEVEVQVILTAKEAEQTTHVQPIYPIPANKVGEDAEPKPSKKANLAHLVGKYKHYTPEQNAKIDRELRDLRDSWERPIF